MEHSADVPGAGRTSYTNSTPNEAHASGVSWSAVFAGAFTTAALALILLSLGSGLGMSSVSMWSNEGVTASTFGTVAIFWVIFTQLISSSMGGYLAGRLRTKWASIHTDEVYFRDTAHGFLSWSVALVISAAFLASAATSLVGSSLSSGQSKSGAVTQTDGPNAYFVDSLFRDVTGKTDGVSAGKRAEASVIMAHSLKAGELAPDDRTYLGQLVSSSTGLAQAGADQRVSQTFTTAQQTAETARKAVAHMLLWTFIALLIGAFCSSLSATFGGRQRDHVVTL